MAVALFQSAVSTQYVQVQVLATVNGVAYNPTSDVVAMAFVPAAFPAVNPTSGQWNAATWESDPGGVYWASCLVGPANEGIVLAVGSYVVWTRVTDSPAVPALPGPILNIT